MANLMNWFKRNVGGKVGGPEKAHLQPIQGQKVPTLVSLPTYPQPFGYVPPKQKFQGQAEFKRRVLAGLDKWARANGVPMTGTGFSFAPRTAIVPLRVSPSYFKRVRANAVQIGLYAGLDEGNPPRIFSEGSTTTFEFPLPKAMWQEVNLTTLRKMGALNGTTTALGLAGNKPFYLEFNKSDLAHLLIAGATGSGKTNAQKLIVYGLAQNLDNQILIFDGKGGSQWPVFNGAAALLTDVIQTPSEVENWIKWLDGEFQRRKQAHLSDPPLYVVVDELKVFLEDYKGSADLLERLAEQGREFGIHLIVATQYPNISLLGGKTALRRNLTARLVGKVDDDQSAKNATGRSDTGAEQLLGNGDFLFINGPVQRVTIAFLTDQEIATLPRRQGKPVTIEQPELEVPISFDHAPAAAAPTDREQKLIDAINKVGCRNYAAIQRELGYKARDAAINRRVDDVIQKWPQLIWADMEKKRAA